MNVISSPKIVSFHSRYEQNSNYHNTVQQQSFNQSIGSNSNQLTKDKYSGSKRLIRACKFFIGSFAILALLHKRMIMKSKRLARKLALISAAIAIIHSVPRKKHS